MDWEYEIDHEARLVRLRIAGALEHGALCEMSDEIRKDPRFDPDFDQIVDLSRADSALVRADTVWRFAGRACNGRGEGLRAFVAPGDLEFGMARMWELATQQRTDLVSVFRERVEAEAWLREARIREASEPPTVAAGGSDWT